MIHFFLGTKAQLIKTAPVMLELDRRGVPYRFIDSGQHAEFTDELREEIDLRPPDYRLGGDQDVATYGRAIGWLGAAARDYLFRPRWIRETVFASQGGICVVHGDTASTLIGARFAGRARIPVAHLESGLRSFNLFNPFPEEWIRIQCMKRSALLFAPSEEAMENLKQMRAPGAIIATNGNTAADAIQLALASNTEGEADAYILATFHRLETLNSKRRLQRLIEVLNLAAEVHPVRFVMHKPTEIALRKHDLLRRLDERVEPLPMASYFRFARLILNAQAVLADGGSIQEECAILGKPLLVLRERTERADGLGENAVLGEFSLDIAQSFFADIPSRRRPQQFPTRRPSDIIADHLESYAEPNSTSSRTSEPSDAANEGELSV